MFHNQDREKRAEERLSQTIAFLLVFTFSTIYLFTFCRIDITNGFVGYGDIFYRTLKRTGMQNIGASNISYGTASIILTLILLFIIYPLDVMNWGKQEKGATQRVLKVLRYCILFGSFLCFIGTCLLIGNQMAYAPYLAFTVASVGTFTYLKMTIFENISELLFFRGVNSGLAVSFLVVLGLWITSLAQGNVYDFQVQLKYHERLSCPQGTETFRELMTKAAVDSEFRVKLLECPEAYLIFISPFIFLAGCLIFVVSLIFLSRARKRGTDGLEPSAQVFIALVLLSIFGLWVAASLSTITKSLSSSVLTISCIVLAALLGIWFGVFGVDQMINQLKSTALGKKGFDFLSNDWGKALLVFTSTPIILLVFCLNFLKQFIRRKTFLGKELTNESEKNAKFTPSVQSHVEKFKEWEAGSVIPKVLIWGMVYFLFSVGVTRIVVVLLSVLRVSLRNVNLVSTCFILVGVGLVFFLLPPIPGVPIYIALGVIIPDKAEPQLGFIGGIFLAIALSFALKLLALVMQQKLIGELWGSNSVWVRKTVGINTVNIRATRRLLREPGLSFSKVVILVGGPDWPTSVLTGIMRLSVFQMLLGTLPVILLIAPTVVSGAFVVRATGNDLISTLSTVSIFFSAFIQGFALLWAVQVIASTAVRYKDELEKEEPDEEVLERELKEKARVEKYNEVTRWDNLSIVWRITNVMNMLLMIVSCYGFLLLGRYLFVPFEIQDDIATELNGNVFNLVKTPGWICLGMFAISTIYYYVFRKVFDRKIPSEAADDQVQDELDIITP